MGSKSALRRRLLRARISLPADEVAGKSAVIVEQLKSLLLTSHSNVVHCFQPIQEFNEVDVWPLIELLQANQPQLHIYTSSKINDQWQVVSAAGEPVKQKPRYDYVIVPMLGFDGNRQRLGYGSGYYDRLLVEQPQAQKIGVCFEQGHLKQLPHEAHDIALDLIITEKQIYGAL